jgi:hypothetical protein
MKFIDLVAGIFKPAADLIDNLHTSEHERLQMRAELLTLQAAAMDSMLDYEKSTLQARAGIVQAEAQSEHWVTATWRPITMLTLLGLVVLDSFGLLTMAAGTPLKEDAWLLLQIGLGGYVVGRSGEKIVETLTKSRIAQEKV